MRGYESNISFLKFAHKPIFTGQKYWRYELINKPYVYNDKPMYRRAIQSDYLKSKYGFSWKEVRGEKDLEFNVWGGEISVHDLKTKEILAVKKGFVYVGGNRSDICPKGKHDYFIYDFVSKVLKPKKHME